MKLKGKFQGENEIVIGAEPGKIWDVLTDGTILSRWMSIVKHTTSNKECLDAVRSCDVEMNGKKGKVREKCVLYEKNSRIGWEMEWDTFGFSRMFDNYVFSFELVPINASSTRVINRGFYDSKNMFVWVLNIIVMKRKFAEIRKTALKSLKTLIEKDL